MRTISHYLYPFSHAWWLLWISVLMLATVDQPFFEGSFVENSMIATQASAIVLVGAVVVFLLSTVFLFVTHHNVNDCRRCFHLSPKSLKRRYIIEISLVEKLRLPTSNRAYAALTIIGAAVVLLALFVLLSNALILAFFLLQYFVLFPISNYQRLNLHIDIRQRVLEAVEKAKGESE